MKKIFKHYPMTGRLIVTRGYSNGHYISGFYLTFVICVVFSSPDLKDHVSYCNHSVSVDIVQPSIVVVNISHFDHINYWPIRTNLCRNHVYEVFYIFIIMSSFISNIAAMGISWFTWF